YWGATKRARVLARGEGDQPTDGDKPVTIKEALAAYQVDLEARGGDVLPLNRVHTHLSAGLAGQPVALLKAAALLRWKNGLRKSLKPGSINRIANSLRAALNLAADNDDRISRRSWEAGLKAVPGGAVARNVILAADEVRRIVGAAYGIGQEFRL